MNIEKFAEALRPALEEAEAAEASAIEALARAREEKRRVSRAMEALIGKPTEAKPKRKQAKAKSVTPATIEKVVPVLKAEGQTIGEISKAAGLHTTTVSHALDFMRTPQGGELVRLVGKRVGEHGHPAKLFALAHAQAALEAVA